MVLGTHARILLMFFVLFLSLIFLYAKAHSCNPLNNGELLSDPVCNGTFTIFLTAGSAIFLGAPGV